MIRISNRFEGRVAVVTGGASGIGEAVARALHAEGASVVIADVQEAGRALADRLGERIRFLRTDVTVESDVAAAVDLAVASFGRLDVMFNNAGVMGTLGPIDRTPMAEADLTLAVNLRGVLCGFKHAARVMKPQGSGVIISTSSPAGVLGGVGPHVYSAAKAAVIGLSNSVAAELRPFGVRVNTVIPGAVVSPMTAAVVATGADDLAGATAALGDSALMNNRALTPEDVAAGVLFLASDEAAYMTGVTFPVDAGMTGISGRSPYTSGRYEQPVTLLEAGRTAAATARS
ncbi:SDR family oxidoreductase [Rhodococcus artemisiae]|uniref:SDR family oxidoreductase n=1 Tax=Rhodococcus artemisiae TaxID=714159 RepID=A0ABU7L5Y7_9NOCA|nr:SDR family oxidoreductase [Rhodococcus artemisiae]MEE2056965.1 SDR family oxidoreductase [Rhodococcus artemisiae]